MNIRKLVQYFEATTHCARLSVAACLPALALSGCYVMPVGAGSDGTQHYIYSPLPIVPASSGSGAHPVAVPAGPMPVTVPRSSTP